MPRNPASRSRLANDLKQQLIEFLGGRCEECGTTHDLEINHIYGRDYRVRDLSHYNRILRYWREARMVPPRVDLRCSTCNREYRPLPLPQAVPQAAMVEQPF